MNFLSGLIAGVGLAAAGVAGWLLLAPVPKAEKTPPVVPASVPVPLKEERIGSVILKPGAAKVLGLKTGEIVKKRMARSRTYGGEVMVAVGHTAIAAAPVAGTVLAPVGGMPRPGQAVKKGQALLQLVPLLTPEARATLGAAELEAEGQVKAAETQLELGKIALQRAERLLKSEAGSQRAVDEATAARDLAQRALDATRARRKLLTEVLGDAKKGTATPLVIESPEDGTLRTLSALAGQAVPGGAALFDVVDLASVWVRVPVYAGEIDELDRTSAALVSPLTGKGSRSASPADAPPQANALMRTVDLFYALDNRESGYSPGHGVAVAIPLKGEAESLVAPTEAILHDIHGGTWVYVAEGSDTFTRKRVIVRWTRGGEAVLAHGPGAGTKVVTAASAELFGAEAGFTK